MYTSNDFALKLYGISLLFLVLFILHSLGVGCGRLLYHINHQPDLTSLFLYIAIIHLMLSSAGNDYKMIYTRGFFFISLPLPLLCSSDGNDIF